MSGKQRSLRKRRAADDEDGPPGAEQEVHTSTLEDLKLLQKQRKRATGVDAAALATMGGGAAGNIEDNDLMEAYVKAQEGGQNVMDEQAHMQKYIEQELARRLGKTVDAEEKQLSKQEQEELELYAVPEGLKAQLKQEVNIPGLTTAITEVDVSVEDKLKKIEETEAIKRRMLSNNMGRGLDDGDGRVGGKMRRSTVPFAFGKGPTKAARPPGDASPQKRKWKVHLRDKDVGRPAHG